MERLRLLALPAYLTAALLLLVPLLDTALSVLPPRLGEVAWRFGATGLFSRALMTPLLGLLLAFTTALLLEHRRVLRGLAVLSGTVAVVLLGTSLLFLLDAVQMRAQVRPEAKLAFDVASLVALMKYGMGMVIVVAFAFSAWKASGRDRAEQRERRSEPERSGGLLVGARAPVQ